MKHSCTPKLCYNLYLKYYIRDCRQDNNSNKYGKILDNVIISKLAGYISETYLDYNKGKISPYVAEKIRPYSQALTKKLKFFNTNLNIEIKKDV